VSTPSYKHTCVAGVNTMTVQRQAPSAWHEACFIPLAMQPLKPRNIRGWLLGAESAARDAS
jgi:hypothetical protein